MAKKAQLRVHKLAKELGISSKDVIAKCEAEGIPGIENHLSPVSIGLAATIREWFSKPEDAEESTTAVETAEKVDLDEARKKAEAEKKRRGTRRRSTTAKAKSEAADESKKEEAKLEQARVEAAIKAQQAEAQARADADVTGDDSASGESDSNAGSAEGTGPNAAVARPNVPDRPDVIAPAGPRVAPEKTKLAGPKVVRIEKPDPVAPPRRHRDGGGPGSAPAAHGGPLSAAHPQVVVGFGILDVVINREVAVVPAPRTVAWAKSLRSTGGSRTTPIVNSDCRNPKASSTAFAVMCVRKMCPPVKRPKPSSKPAVPPPFSLQWC